ncbi:DinB family protein [Streptosporangiaceae bacterium NEAU-GS5]|nr:DinB family protein [Streptosporangiaceae bacterium NEAU-GS5]
MTPITKTFDFIWPRFRQRLEGLTDDEYFWEPVPGSWSVRLSPGGTWEMDGHPTQGPGAPITTIAWRISHIGECLLTFTGRLFGDGALGDAGSRDAPLSNAPLGNAALEDALRGNALLDDALAYEPPPSAAAVAPFLDRCYKGWRDGMGSLNEAAWAQPLGRAFGMYAKDTKADLIMHVLDELIHHSAEVALLRDLYVHRGEKSW